MDKVLMKQIIKTRWNIFVEQSILMFGNKKRKQIAQSRLKSLKRTKELQSYRFKPASKDNLEKAKKLFFAYSCNQYFMVHDGVYEEFKKIGVKYEQEVTWRKEYISYWESLLSLDDLDPIDNLGNSKAVEAIPSIIKLADKGDGYAKLWYANALWELCNTKDEPTDIQKLGTQKSIEIWHELSEKPIGEISENHKKKIMPFLFAMNASSPEEYVRNYSKQKLEKNNS